MNASPPSSPLLVTDLLELWQPSAADLPDLLALIEDEETRRKRLLAQQQQRLLPNSAPGASSLMGGFSAAVPTL